MLGNYDKPGGSDHAEMTHLTGDNGGTYYTVSNCVIRYAEGKAINMFTGEGNLIEDCYMHHMSQ